jgi:predicted AlkP superfamily pyrophosphatase or phosphodiesterase
MTPLWLPISKKILLFPLLLFTGLSGLGQNRPYVMLISADGFRWDYTLKYHATNLLRLSRQGVSAAYMIPCFPSVTLPNHYTIVTGLYPAHHGIVDNFFYDPNKCQFFAPENATDSSWFRGTPLWVLAEQQGIRSAVFYWVGSEAAIQQTRPTYYYPIERKIDPDTRIQIVRDWLTLPEKVRPHLILFYLPDVDHAGHLYGPESAAVAAAVQLVDQTVGKLAAITDSLHLPVNFIFVSDHGMTKVDTVHTLALPAAVDTGLFLVAGRESMLHLYAKDRDDIRPLYKAMQNDSDGFDVYLAESLCKNRFQAS